MRFPLSTLSALLLATAFVSGCGDDTEPSTTTTSGTTTGSGTGGTGTGGTGTGGTGTGGGTGGTGGATSSSASDSASSTTATGTGGTGGGSTVQAKVLAPFDKSKGELPEGVAVKGTDAYVGFAGLSKVVKVALADGKVSDFATGPTLPANEGFLLGLEFDAAGALYATVAGFTANVKAGVYKTADTGGVMTLFASDAAMVFPNDLVFDASGDAYVADSSGKIFKVTKAGATSVWLSDPLLVGKKDNCANVKTQFDIGANGILISKGAIYVANTNLATIVKVPIAGDGKAGKPEVFAGPDCTALGGVDGIIIDGSDNIYAALNGINTIARIDPNAKISVLSAGEPFDFPASLALTGKKLVITNASFGTDTKPSVATLDLP